MKERFEELRRRLLAAWPSVRAVVADRHLRKRWLLSARAAQITLLFVIVAGLSVVPVVFDTVADTVVPPKTQRSWFRRTVRRRPGAQVLSLVLQTGYWLGGLGTSAALLILHAPAVVGRRREDEDAIAATMEAGPASAIFCVGLSASAMPGTWYFSTTG